MKNIRSVEKCTDLPKDYTPQHICMNQKLSYDTPLPTYGPHRPLWPVFGEYKFVPVQRWLHSLEVMVDRRVMRESSDSMGVLKVALSSQFFLVHQINNFGI